MYNNYTFRLPFKPNDERANNFDILLFNNMCNFAMVYLLRQNV